MAGLGGAQGKEEQFSPVNKRDIHKHAVLPETKFSLFAGNFQIKTLLIDEIT